MKTFFRKLYRKLIDSNQSNVRLFNWLLVVFVTSLLFLSVSINAGLILLSVIITYRLSILTIGGRLFSSRLFIGIVSSFIYTLLLQCVVLMTWLINKNFSLDGSIALSFFLLLFSLVWHRFTLNLTNTRSNHTQISKLEKWSFDDFLSLAVASFIIGIIALSSLLAAKPFESNFILEFANGNVDDAAHVSMINDRIQFNHGLMLGTNTEDALRSEASKSIYPVGWHSANAAIIKSIQPHIATGYSSIIAYVITKLFWFFILIFVFVRVAFSLYNNLAVDKRKNKLAKVYITLGSIIFSYLFLINIFIEGFYSFIPQLIAILLLCLTLSQISLIKKNNQVNFSSLLVVIILCIGGALSWILLLPALVLAVCVVLFYTAHRSNLTLMAFIKALLLDISSKFPIYLSVLGAIVAQLYVMRNSSSTPLGFKATIVLPGGVSIYNEMFYLSLYAGTALCLWLFHRSSKNIMTSFLTVFCSILLLAIFISTIQLALTGNNTYYYYKTLHASTIVLIPIAVVGYSLALAKLAKHSRELSLLLIVALCLVLVQTAGTSNVDTIRYLKGVRNLTSSEVADIKTILENDHRQQNYYEKNITIFDSHRIDGHEIGTMLLKSNRKDSECFNAGRSALRSNENISDALKIMKLACPQDYTVRIVTTKDYLPTAKAAISANALEGKFEAFSLPRSTNP